MATINNPFESFDASTSQPNPNDNYDSFFNDIMGDGGSKGA